MIGDLSRAGIGALDLGIGPRRSQPRRLERMHDVSLLWSNFLIKDGSCCTIYDEDTRYADSSLVNWPGITGVAGVFRSGDDFLLPREPDVSPRRLRRRCARDHSGSTLVRDAKGMR